MIAYFAMTVKIAEYTYYHKRQLFYSTFTAYKRFFLNPCHICNVFIVFNLTSMCFYIYDFTSSLGLRYVRTPRMKTAAP